MTLPIFSAPKHSITIPSVSKMATVRPFTAGEEKILLMALQSGEEKDIWSAVRQIIDQCVEGYKVDDLTFFDLEWVFLKLRSISQGSEIMFEIVDTNKDSDCPKCKSGILVKANIDDAKVEGIVKDKKILFEAGGGIVMKYPTFKELNTLKNLDTSLPELDQAFLMISSCVDYVFDNDKVYKFNEYKDLEKIEYLKSIPGKEFIKIENFYQNLPSVVLHTTAKCPQCSKEHKYTLRGILDFFV